MMPIALEFTGYGYRRVTKELRLRDFQVGRKRVQRLMRDDNLLCLRKFKWPKTTDSNHNFPVYPNLAKNLHLTNINQLWVSDITYIRRQKEFLYLAVIIDVYSRKCVVWHLDDTLDSSLTVTALKRALVARWHPGLRGKLIHHSDRGGLDLTGDVWIATQGGVSRYIPNHSDDERAFQNFTTANGLVYNYVTDVLQTPDGALWFAT